MLAQQRKLGQFAGIADRRVLRGELRIGDKNSTASSDPSHLQVGVRIKPFSNPHRDVDAFVDEVHSPVCSDEKDPQLGMLGQKGRKSLGDGPLQSDRTAHADKAARFGVHPLGDVFDRFRCDNGGLSVLIDLLAHLRQSEMPRAALEEADAKTLFQHGYASAESRFWKAERPCSGRKAAVVDHRGEEVQIVEIQHRSRSRTLNYAKDNYPILSVQGSPRSMSRSD